MCKRNRISRCPCLSVRCRNHHSSSSFLVIRLPSCYKFLRFRESPKTERDVTYATVSYRLHTCVSRMHALPSPFHVVDKCRQLFCLFSFLPDKRSCILGSHREPIGTLRTQLFPIGYIHVYRTCSTAPTPTLSPLARDKQMQAAAYC